MPNNPETKSNTGEPSVTERAELVKSYADSTYALLEAIDNQNGVELATLLDESLFAVPVYDEH